MQTMEPAKAIVKPKEDVENPSQAMKAIGEGRDKLANITTIKKTPSNPWPFSRDTKRIAQATI